MSTEEQAETEEAAEPSVMSERTAKIVLLAVGFLAMWGIVAVLPETAYFVAGIMACRGWQKAASWIVRRRGDDEDDTKGEEPGGETVPETLHRLADPHVFLADFAEARGLPKDEARALLEAVGVPVRRAVRNGTRTGVGVHKDDLPPLPRPLSAAPVGGVDQGQPTNQQGLRVDRTDWGTTMHPTGATPAAAPSAEDKEAERLRLQAYLNRVYAAREEAFEDHLTDALDIVRGEVKGP